MKHYFYAAGAILCWASLPVATGSGLRELSTEELMFFSFVSAAIYLYLQDIVLTRTFSLYIPGLKASLFGVSGIFLYHYTYYKALSYAPLAEGAILATTWSFWIVFFSSLLIFKRLKFSIVVTAAVGMSGAALVIAAGKEVSFSLEYMKGYLLALLCGLIWSSFSVGLRYVKVNREPMTIFTIYAALLSTLLYVVTLPHTMPSFGSLAAAIYLGCVPLGLSFFLWNRAVTGGNMVIIGFLSYLTPPLAVLLVALIHGKAVSSQVLVGMVVIIGASIAGRVLLSRSQKREQAVE
ncbi:MAG: DMT family transporter [Desulfopila sp.]|jgi:drug/metabolite transporter (DMT)-like permease|nr:DMT family transporter [Desulfopila sp.]